MTDKQVEILHILNGAQDYETALDAAGSGMGTSIPEFGKLMIKDTPASDRDTFVR